MENQWRLEDLNIINKINLIYLLDHSTMSIRIPNFFKWTQNITKRPHLRDIKQDNNSLTTVELN